MARSMKQDLTTLSEFDVELIGLLELCKIKRLVIAGPPYKMETREYKKLARFMKSIGGEWSKKEFGFVIQMAADYLDETFLEMLVSGLQERKAESEKNGETVIQPLSEQLARM